ncbi:hypothetical protein PVL29_004840 [Vitis rotundifolia]|uniref:Uncharacterized protein n=1 Tax=Vitis rotundifolia TaxID=103349 RepID=A0AA39AB51_VITRO|nr:hypothetical protein PVL29_004840 [Vitis rotundifolia]
MAPKYRQANSSSEKRPKNKTWGKRAKTKIDGNGDRVEESSSSQSDTGADFFTLPEACIVDILAMTSPADVCRMRAVAKWLQPTVDSDDLWVGFIPDDYKQILHRSAESPSWNDSSSKKELFFRLCDSPLLIDEGKKMFWLEKRSGKKCFMLAAREVVLINREANLSWCFVRKSTQHLVPKSGFSQYAYLHGVVSLRIEGVINACMLSPRTNYAAYLVFNLKQNYASGLEDVVVKSSIKIGDKTTTRWSYLKRRMTKQMVWYCPQDPTVRKDGWLEIELGGIFRKGGEDIKMKIEQLDCIWKCGLMVEGIEIRPRDMNFPFIFSKHMVASSFTFI